MKVAGQRSTCGRKPAKFGEWTCADSRDFRRERHLMAGERGQRISGRKIGVANRAKHRRHRRHAWIPNFLKSFARTGQIASAANLSGVSSSTVHSHLQRAQNSRENCATSMVLLLGEHVLSRLQRMSDRSARAIARGNTVRRERVILWPREARALVAYIGTLDNRTSVPV